MSGDINDDEEILPPFRIFLFSGLCLAGVGWGGLYYLIQYELPTIGPRWLFFFLLTLALSGVALPIAYLLNYRFSDRSKVTGGMIVRQAIWVGVFGDILAWLQLGRILSFSLAVIIAIGIGFIEYLIQISERSKWEPGREVE